MRKDARQAVIVIHGIGEQMPMQTLRGLVRNLGLGPAYSRPDRLSEVQELRRLSLRLTSSRPRTDFFELYWAHHMVAGGKLEPALWALRLLTRRASWRGTPIAKTLNVVTVSILALGFVLAIPTTRSWLLERWEGRTFWGGVVIWLATSAVGGFLAHHLGDAARYLTPRPSNIDARAAIRNEGLHLLRRIHDSGTYSRVVVVGHSLGSVIGYDILRTYWDEARGPDTSTFRLQPVVQEFERAVKGLPTQPSTDQIEQLQQLQLRLWRELRRDRVPWLVTDFITLGSPLANAPMLLSTKDDSITALIEDRELPACPPVGSGGNNVAGFYSENFTVPGPDGQPVPRAFRLADSGATFACTRWTNLYFPIRGLIFGDLVGGPIAPVFGRGVRDVPVHRTLNRSWRTFFRRIFPAPHTAYWSPFDDAEPKPAPPAAAIKPEDQPDHDQPSPTREALPALRHFLGLDLLRAKLPFPDPDPPVQSRPLQTHG